MNSEEYVDDVPKGYKTETFEKVDMTNKEIEAVEAMQNNHKA